MDFNDNKEEAEFRAEAAAWLKANVPTEEEMAGLDELAAAKMWQKRKYDAGWACIRWDKEFGGRGANAIQQVIWNQEEAKYKVPAGFFVIGQGMAAPTLMTWGQPEHHARYLPKLASGEEIWCQLFSEPAGGSDLAALRTKAERDGDDWVINGQKIWSTMGQYADRCLLLARSSNSGPPQAGLTYLLLDMKAKGVSVRPIHQITGDDEFAEVFFDDVEVPIEERVGEEGAGWAVAQATLASERGLTLVELSQRMRYALPMLVTALESSGGTNDGALKTELGELITRVDAACAVADQYLLKRISGREVVGDASIVKLYYSRTLRAFTSLGLKIGGLDAQYLTPHMRGATQETGAWMLDFMNSYNWTIAGGSDEVQRNIIAERMLGMQREPRNWIFQG